MVWVALRVCVSVRRGSSVCSSMVLFFPHVECGWLSLVCCWLAMLAVDDIVAVIHVMPLIATIEWTSNFGLVTYDPKTAVSALLG